MIPGVGFGELVVICIVLIIAVGPERLPSMMRTIGRTLRTLRQASRDIRSATGIDELMRDDLLDPPRPPPRRPAPPEGPAPTPRIAAPAAEPAPLPAPASEPAPVGAVSNETKATAAEPTPPKPDANPPTGTS
ncbi:MAG TPA: twin-arginine translocase TatA/TatE family subunit [Polyangiales bacterium]|jgi:sec-independent protein translocase protein TatB|nr:twin-arginine translocase TatA/TatE family subunit [Polyangiales bacterium]